MTARSDAVNRLMQNARINAPAAIDQAILNELFQASRDFFRDSLAWQRDITFTINPTLSPQNYVLTPTSGLIFRLMKVLNASQRAQQCAMPTLGTVFVVNPPSTAEVWTATVALIPVTVQGDLAPDMPDDLFGRWSSELTDGTLARLYAQPSKPYSNKDLAGMRASYFKSGVINARDAVNQQNLQGGQTWNFPGFASGSQRR